MIGNFDRNQEYELDVDNNIIGLTGSATVDYYVFEQEMESAEFNQEGEYSTENGTVFFDQQLIAKKSVSINSISINIF